jgi:hypothetical protein
MRCVDRTGLPEQHVRIMPPAGTARRSRLSPRLIARIAGALSGPHPRQPSQPLVKAVRCALLDEAGLQGEPRQVCPPSACSLVADAV